MRRATAVKLVFVALVVVALAMALGGDPWGPI